MYKDDEDGVLMERKGDLEKEGVEAISAKVTSSKNACLLVVVYVPPAKKEQRRITLNSRPLQRLPTHNNHWRLKFLNNGMGKQEDKSKW